MRILKGYYFNFFKKRFITITIIKYLINNFFTTMMKIYVKTIFVTFYIETL